MKLTKQEFKQLVKVCLKELISEGFLTEAVAGVSAAAVDQQQQQRQRRLAAKAVAAQVVGQSGQSGQSASVMENILLDTMNITLVEQTQAEDLLSRGGLMSASPVMPIQRAPLPPRTAGSPEQFLNEQKQQVAAAQQQNPQMMTKWAQLAFNKPISNRPNAQTAGLFGVGGGSAVGSLPGQKPRGSFD